jgi:hypothetical protein
LERPRTNHIGNIIIALLPLFSIIGFFLIGIFAGKSTTYTIVDGKEIETLLLLMQTLCVVIICVLCFVSRKRIKRSRILRKLSGGIIVTSAIISIFLGAGIFSFAGQSSDVPSLNQYDIVLPLKLHGILLVSMAWFLLALAFIVRSGPKNSPHH